MFPELQQGVLQERERAALMLMGVLIRQKAALRALWERRALASAEPLVEILPEAGNLRRLGSEVQIRRFVA